MFLLVSLVSAVSGVGLHLYTSRLRSDHNFGRVHHLAIAATSILSLAVFDLDHDHWFSLLFAIINLLGLMFVPTHLTPEEEKIEGAGTNVVHAGINVVLADV
jgi:hypothetical protein